MNTTSWLLTDLSSSPYLLLGVWGILVFSTLPIHELGHALYARIGMGAKSVTIKYSFPGSTMVTQAHHLKWNQPRDRILMRASGIIAGFIPLTILGMFSWLFWSIAPVYLFISCRQDLTDIFDILRGREV